MRPEAHPFVEARIAALIHRMNRIVSAEVPPALPAANREIAEVERDAKAHLAKGVAAELREIRELIALVSGFEAEADTEREGDQ
jgi:hypothetical protein